MTDENVYTTDLVGTSGLGLVLAYKPSSGNDPNPNSNYTYGSKVKSTNFAKADANDSGSNASGTAHVKADVEYRVVATSRRKLAGCASPATGVLDSWCLDDNKLITNKTATGLCKDQTNDGGTGC